MTKDFFSSLGALIVISIGIWLFVSGILKLEEIRNQSHEPTPCAEMSEWSQKNIPARCLSYWNNK